MDCASGAVLGVGDKSESKKQTNKQDLSLWGTHIGENKHMLNIMVGCQVMIRKKRIKTQRLGMGLRRWHLSMMWMNLRSELSGIWKKFRTQEIGLVRFLFGVLVKQ